MHRLTAKYTIDLLNFGKGLFRINRPIADLYFKTKIDDFDAELCLSSEEAKSHGAATIKGDDYWSTSKIRILVGRDEDIAPPIPKLVDGHNDFTGLRQYYAERSPAYQKAAFEIINRAILFFKYKLHNPNLSTLNIYDVRNPAWIVEGQREITPTLLFDSRLYNPKPGLGIENLSHEKDADLERALQYGIHQELSEELMSDAQSALLQGNLRRAVLEMAIACETAVKQAFFAKATPAGAAYEYLEDKRSVSVPIVDMIDAMAKQAFGRSFREDESTHYRNVNFLFRCRNKVAHRGELVYKDDSNNMHTVTGDTLATWWESVLILLDWIEARTPT
jgi:hypothetical protein